MFKVHDIFKSFQGEGIDIGMPMIFIRFAGCNLHCAWCDTTYASREGSKFKQIGLPEILEEVDKFSGVKGITLTGGEPFVQDMELIDALIYELAGRGFFVNIETNGTIFPKLKVSSKLVDRFSISPKLQSSKNEYTVNLTVLEKYIKTYKHKIFLKFVISNQADYNELSSVLHRLEGLRGTEIPIVLQPNVNPTKAESIDNQIKAFKEVLKIVTKNNHTELIRKFNIRIIPQFHKILWKNKKGV